MIKAHYGTMPDGREVESYTLDNGQVKARFLTHGAALDQLWVPDKSGDTAGILVGHPNLEDRLANNTCRGEIAGRVANRIAGAKFMLNGTEYKLTPSPKGPFCLHGANEFNRAIWAAKPVGDHAIAFYYTSPDGSHGFPGEVKTCVRYTLEGSALLVEYEATTDADTLVNLTNHAYFNLAGEGQIFDQLLRIDADHYTPLTEELCPTGEVAPVVGTKFDFRALRPIREAYDINFCNPRAIEACDPVSGRRMTVETDLPGVQLYTGECLCEPFTGFCLETQLWPDAPNQPDFPSVMLKAGETWKSWTKFSFDVV